MFSPLMAVPLVFVFVCFHLAYVYIRQVRALERVSTREKLSRYVNNAVSVVCKRNLVDLSLVDLSGADCCWSLVSI
jgi:hypothetical protein